MVFAAPINPPFTEGKITPGWLVYAALYSDALYIPVGCALIGFNKLVYGGKTSPVDCIIIYTLEIL